MRNFRPYLVLIAIIMFMSSFCINHLLAEYETKKQPSQDSESYAKDAELHPVQNHSATGKEKEVSSEVKNKLCPVDFKKITPDTRYSYTYKDKIYFFHSPKCIEEFKSDPDGYLNAWEKKERFYKINIIYD
ncbi:MAG: hypothetical protein A3J51_03595 [Omnitrophica WOR_2 bacterium RIFCSPHIGHO2_02_FULL_45_21]|nr:MAG: hypothetical protein A3J51_03595 [Omnitrophica WOR_2 bacterium RIFCSPHIGHO2_02_FULL_45_21]